MIARTESNLSIEPMLDRKSVASTIGVSMRTLEKRMSSADFRRQIGAKRCGHVWRFVAWRVKMFAESAA